jgi:phosphate uptake regulator
MEQRKLIALGKSSYAITLPKDWVDRNSLEKGDFISVLMNRVALLLFTPLQIWKRKLSV